MMCWCAPARRRGIAAFTGDGTDPNVMTQATRAIAAAGGLACPPSSPGTSTPSVAKMEQARRESGCFAVAMDVDAAGLPFLKKPQPAGRQQERGGAA